MARNALVLVLVAVWIGLFGMSFYAAMAITPTGAGFTRGLDRATTVLSWQGVALVVALGALCAGLNARTTRLIWLSRGPLLVQIVLALLFGVFLAIRLMVT